MTSPDDDKALAVERQRRLNGRNWAVFAALIAFVVLVFIITIIKTKANG